MEILGRVDASVSISCAITPASSRLPHSCVIIPASSRLPPDRVLKAREATLKGTVVLLFQPAEEGRGGALRVIKEDALKGVQAISGIHVWPSLPTGGSGVSTHAWGATLSTDGRLLHRWDAIPEVSQGMHDVHELGSCVDCPNLTGRLLHR